jgi:hypothetical protein
MEAPQLAIHIPQARSPQQFHAASPHSARPRHPTKQEHPRKGQLAMSIEIDLVSGDEGWPRAKGLMEAVWPPAEMEKLS